MNRNRFLMNLRAVKQSHTPAQFRAAAACAAGAALCFGAVAAVEFAHGKPLFAWTSCATAALYVVVAVKFYQRAARRPR